MGWAQQASHHDACPCRMKLPNVLFQDAPGRPCGGRRWMGMATSDWVYFPKRDRITHYTYLSLYLPYLPTYLLTTTKVMYVMYLIGCLISVRTTPHHVS